MKIKTSELEGAALDYAVLIAIGGEIEPELRAPYTGNIIGYWGDDAMPHEFSPSTDWAIGGPLIERILSDGFELAHAYPDCFACSNYTDEGLPYSGDWESPEIRERGPTPLIAACRAIVAAKLGDTVDVPEALL